MVNKKTFCNAEDVTITMVKSDTMSFNFAIKGLGGTADSIAFTCKERIGDVTPLFQKNLNNGISLISYNEAADEAIYCVRVSEADTRPLTPALYYYDLVLLQNYDKITLLRGRLNLIYSVLDY